MNLVSDYDVEDYEDDGELLNALADLLQEKEKVTKTNWSFNQLVCWINNSSWSQKEKVPWQCICWYLPLLSFLKQSLLLIIDQIDAVAVCC